MRRAARADASQYVIVRDLRKAGRTVAVTSSMGDGFPDLVVASPMGVWLIEIKDEAPNPKWEGPWSEKRHKLLTPDQKKFHARWPVRIAIVFTSEEALYATQ